MCSQKCARPEMFPGSDKEPKQKKNKDQKKICTYYDNNTRIINQSDFTFTIFFLGAIFRKGRLTPQERQHLESRSVSPFFPSFSFDLRNVQQHEANSICNAVEKDASHF